MPSIPAPKVDGTTLTMKAAIVPIPDDQAESPNGEFEVILATPDKDREGEEAKGDEWKQPLPDHITFDSDHGMDVKSLVGSGAPTLMSDGSVRVKGTYAATEHAQMVRGLVNDPARHIRSVSVTFLSRKRAAKGANGRNQVVVERELLNGSFVTVPANPNAVILSSKSASANDGADGTAPAGGTNPDPREMLQAIHNAAVHMGAECVTAAEEADEMAAQAEESSGSKSLTAVTIVTKGIAGSVEDLQQRVSAAVRKTAGPREYPWVRATFLDDSTSKGTVVYELDGPGAEAGTYARGFTDNGTDVELDEQPRAVSLITTVVDDQAHTTEPTAAGKGMGTAITLLMNQGMTRAEAAAFLGVNNKGVTLASSETAAATEAAAAATEESVAAAAADTEAAAPLTTRADALVKSLDAAATG